jgi:hypothetical protein
MGVSPSRGFTVGPPEPDPLLDITDLYGFRGERGTAIITHVTGFFLGPSLGLWSGASPSSASPVAGFSVSHGNAVSVRAGSPSPGARRP